jgi:hypothetical protein
MNTFIVTFDLGTPASNHERLGQKIRAHQLWARLCHNTYLIKTGWTVSQVRNDLRKVLKPGDKLFVGYCPVPSAWYGQPEDVSKWILENQPKS